MTELPRVAAGTRASQAVRVPLDSVLEAHVQFVNEAVTGFDFAGRQLLTASGSVPYTHLVLALGSRPNDFGIPGLKEHALSLWSADDADKILKAIERNIVAAAACADTAEKAHLLTVLIGGGGATGVELAGELAEVLPELLKRHDLGAARARIVLIEAGPTLLAGSSQKLIELAGDTLRSLGVEVHLGAVVIGADERGFLLKDGRRFEAGVQVWAGGVKAPALVAQSGLPTGPNGRIRVEPTLRVAGRPEIYVAGDLAYLMDEATGRALPPTAQIALEEADTVAANLLAELDGHSDKLTAFAFRNKGYVVSVGPKSGAADVGPLTLGGRPASILKNAIEWEYRQSVKHLKGWSPL
jgi:NADH dehydrogenase